MFPDSKMGAQHPDQSLCNPCNNFLLVSHSFLFLYYFIIYNIFSHLADISHIYPPIPIKTHWIFLIISFPSAVIGGFML